MATDAALKWLRQRPKDPFFLWVHYFDPHMPHRPPKKFLDLVRKNVSAYGKDKFSISYDAEILYMDQEFGRFLFALRDMELIDKSFIVLHADHGEEMGLHGVIGHGVNLYEGNMRVPLIFRGAGWPANHCITHPVSLMDIAPTILKTLGFPREPTFQGQSLFPLQNPGASLPSKPVYMETHFQMQFPPKRRNANKEPIGLWKRGLSAAQYKLIQTYTGKPYGSKKRDPLSKEGEDKFPIPFSVELFDILEDPKEIYNLSEKNGEIKKKMGNDLKKLFLSNKRLRKNSSEPALNDEDRDKLRSLGYLR